MENGKRVNVSSLQNVPETMLIPLYLKAKETKENGIITDKKAVEIVEQINYDFSKFAKDWKTQISVAVRTEVFDKILATLSAANKDLVVVNLGAGLDTREERFPNIKWYQLDLPQSIAIRKQFFTNGKSITIPKSILDFSWVNDIQEKENVLFIAEGLLMYFDEAEVKSVFETIAKHFTHSFIAFNTIHKSMTGKKHTSVDTNKAPLKWGTLSNDEIENWNLGWKQKELFYPLEYHRSRWGWMRLLSLFRSMRNGFIIALMETKK